MTVVATGALRRVGRGLVNYNVIYVLQHIHDGTMIHDTKTRDNLILPNWHSADVCIDKDQSNFQLQIR